MIHKIITYFPPDKQKLLIDILEVINIHKIECERVMTSSNNNFQPFQFYIVDRNGKSGEEFLFLVTFIKEEIFKQIIKN